MRPSAAGKGSSAMTLILVIDDQAEMRRSVTRILSRAGYEVLEAHNGEAGLAVLRNRMPQLVITDLIMPGKEGIETILEIRRDRRAVKILAMSGGSIDQAPIYLDAASKLGADQVIAKPFRAAALLDVVERLLVSP
jgi:CheY-like chemotaxis protein